jgi:hypothetical protein
MTSISFRFSASVSEYDAASLTAFTASSTGRPRGSVTERRSAETSSPTFFAIVFGRSSPPPPTGDAAPAFVPGAIAAMSHDMRTMKPAEAACDPGGATQPTTGTGEPSIACAITRVESSRPPCVSMRRMTSGARAFPASLIACETKRALTAWISVSRSMTTAGAGRGAPWAARAEYSRNAAAERTAAL